MPLLEEGLRLAREQGERLNLGWALNDLGKNLLFEGRDLQSAMDIVSESIDVSAELGNRQGLSQSLSLLGRICQRLGDFRKSRDYIGEALNILRELGTEQAECVCLSCLAAAEAKLRDPAKAARLLGAVSGFHERYVFIPTSNRRDFNQIKTDVRSAMGDKAFDTAWEKGRVMSVEQAIDYALAE